MRVHIRTDASQTIGHGHVRRCLTLASKLRKYGAKVFFVCREHDGHLCGLIEARGYGVSRLPEPEPDYLAEDTPVHSAWLGCSWKEDAEQTRAAIESSGTKPDWLVVDHYGLEHRWESSMRESVDRVMVIDDLADRKHDCDLLLDQNLVAKMHTRYGNKIPDACVMLLGPEYALLQPMYAHLHERMPPRQGPIRRIFISFGGADNANLTCRALDAFVSLDEPEIEVDVLISSCSKHADVIRQRAARHGNVHLYEDVPTLAPLIAKADLAIGACGSTSWERLCLGLPTVAVVVADNQQYIAEELDRRGLIRWLGQQDDVDERTISEVLGKLLQLGLDAEWSNACRAIVDGHGVNRVCAALTVTASTLLRVRHAGLEDEDLLLAWANDPTTRRNAFSSEPIPAATHRLWFHNRLRNPDGCRLYVVETTDGTAVGQVRFERQERGWEIDYTLAPVFRGRGLGCLFLEAALLELRSDVPDALIFGQVKECNHASRKIFESLGFKAEAKAGAVVEYRCVL